MSGRLIILPKKSYCPWNAKNVERVERDERDHREAQERERRGHDEDTSRARVETLKRQRRLGGRDGGSERFRLFEREERLQLESQKQHAHHNHAATTATDGRPMRSSADGPGAFRRAASNAASSFYMLPRPKDGPLDAKEIRRRQTMDPMRAFDRSCRQNGLVETHEVAESTTTTTSNKCEGKTQRKHSRRHRNHESSASNSDEDPVCSGDDSSIGSRKRDRKRRKKNAGDKKSKRRHRMDESLDKPRKRAKGTSIRNPPEDSIEELRKRRAEREEKERKRQEEIIDSSKSNRQISRYMDQYNPGFSRK